MTAQHLFDPGPGEHGLTENQQTVYKAAQDSGPDGGITATEAGLLLHAHPDGRPCVWCKGRGREVLEALKRRGLVRRRKTGVYQPVRARHIPGDFPPGF